MPVPGESSLNGLYSWLFKGKRPRPQFPRAVLTQTISRCNAKCIFCCHSTEPEAIQHGRMEDGLINKIIDEIGQNKFWMGRFSPFLINEPLMDTRMPEILARARKVCGPLLKTEITTNAGLLTEDVARRLIDAKLSQLWISVNGYTKETYEATMGIDYDKSMANIQGFLDLKKRMGARRPSVYISTVITNITEGERDMARAFWADKDVELEMHEVDNRIGESKAKELRSSAHTNVDLRRHCKHFLKKCYIIENGDMIICCNDWRHTVVVGNVVDKSIREVWNSKHFKELIYEFYAHNYSNLEICRTCR